MDALFKSFIDNLCEQSPKDYQDGMGTIYERVKLNNFLKTLIDKYHITSVLEGPSDGLTGVRGLGSSIFALNGIPVTYVTPSEKEAEMVRKHWEVFETAYGKKLPHNVIVSDELLSDLADNSYDLIWNFCVIEHFANPSDILKAMKRVSKRFVMVQNQNIWNMGTIPHIIYHKLSGEPWNHGSFKYMFLGKLKKIVSDNNLKVLEEGLIDVPPWMDTWNMPFRWIFQKISKITGGDGNWRWSIMDSPDLTKYADSIKKLSFIEDSKIIPIPIKFMFAHHGYILSEKVS